MITMDDIIRDGHPTLRKVAQDVELPPSDEVKALGKEMMEFLLNSQDEEIAEKYGLRAGVGLAAPQVNHSIRMTAVHIPTEELDEDGNIILGDPEFSDILINPVITRESVAQSCLPGGEGCLSVDEEIPGYVPRATRITLEYYNLDNEKQTVKLKGYPAIVVQHEIDHLNGILFYDRINQENPYELPEKTRVLSFEDE